MASGLIAISNARQDRRRACLSRACWRNAIDSFLAEGVDADDLGTRSRAGLVGPDCGMFGRRLVGHRGTLCALLRWRTARSARLLLRTAPLGSGGRFERLAGPGVGMRGLAVHGGELMWACALSLALVELQAVWH